MSLSLIAGHRSPVGIEPAMSRLPKGAAGPGWFDSSRELRAGLTVLETWLDDAMSFGRVSAGVNLPVEAAACR